MQFRAASDQAILVYLGEEIGQAAHERVVKLLRMLQQEPPRWIRNVQPAYCSLLVNFDLSLADHAEVEETIRSYEQRAEKQRAPKTRTIEIPVCYGGEFGTDLEEVAAAHGLKPEKVIELHSSETYRAYFLGFAPGFAYLGEVPRNCDASSFEPSKESASRKCRNRRQADGCISDDDAGRVASSRPDAASGLSRRPQADGADYDWRSGALSAHQR